MPEEIKEAIQMWQCPHCKGTLKLPYRIEMLKSLGDSDLTEFRMRRDLRDEIFDLRRKLYGRQDLTDDDRNFLQKKVIRQSAELRAAFHRERDLKVRLAQARQEAREAKKAAKNAREFGPVFGPAGQPPDLFRTHLREEHDQIKGGIIQPPDSAKTLKMPEVRGPKQIRKERVPLPTAEEVFGPEFADRGKEELPPGEERLT